MTSHEQELSPEERASFDRLPRELEPPPELRERIRAELKRDRLLGATPDRVRGGRRFRHGRHFVPAVAAAAGFFFLGLWFGQRGPSVALDHVEVEWTAGERLQRFGTAYVDAIASLTDSAAAAGDTTSSRSFSDEAGVVALAALRGAADQLVQLPDVPAETAALLETVRAHDSPSSSQR